MPNLPTTTTTTTEPPQLHLMVYFDWTVPRWLAARTAFQFIIDRTEATVELRPDLTPRLQLRVLSWAASALQSTLTDDGSGFDPEKSFLADDGRRYGPVLRAEDLDGLADPMIECLDCSHLFRPDSSPHDDRCWSCADRFDLAADDR